MLVFSWHSEGSFTIIGDTVIVNLLLSVDLDFDKSIRVAFRDQWKLLNIRISCLKVGYVALSVAKAGPTGCDFKFRL